MKAFYSRQLQDYVIDEMCECGHKKSEHGSMLHKMRRKFHRESNGGSCCSGPCKCKRFTFARFITVEELAQLAVA